MNAARNGRSGTAGDSFDAFISYSHRSDRDLADSLKRSLETFALPLLRSRSMRVFRDETNLEANPNLWASIQRALDDSRVMILLLSPGAARSRWIPKEVAHFVRRRGRQSVCIALSGGVLPWLSPDEPSVVLGRPDTAISRQVYGLLAQDGHEPTVVDLSPFVRLKHDERLASSEYQTRIASLAARILGKDKDAIYGEHLSRQRKILRTVSIVAATFLVLALSTAISNIRERRERDAEAVARQRAEMETKRAESSREQAEAATKRAEAERTRAEAERTRAEGETKRAESEKTRAETQQRRAETEKELAERETGRAEYETAQAEDAREKERQQLHVAQVRLADTLLERAAGERRSGRALQEKGLILSALAQNDTLENRALLLDARFRSPARIWSTGLRCDGVPVFAPDSVHIAIGCSDGAIEVWNLSGLRRELRFVVADGFPVERFAYDHTGQRLVTGDGGAVRVWDAHTGKLLTTMPDHLNSVETIGFTADGRRIVTVDRDDSVRFWDTRATHSARRVPIKGSTYMGAAISPDGRRLAWSYGNDVVLWDIEHEATITELKGGRGQAKLIVFSPDSALLSANVQEGESYTWDLKQGGQLVHEELLSYPYRLALVSPERVAAVGNHQIEVKTPGSASRTIKEIKMVIEPRFLVASPDGRWLATGARLYDSAHDYRAIELGSGHGGPVRSVGFDSTGMRVVSRSRDDVTVLWDAATGRPERVAEGVVSDLPPPADPDGVEHQRVFSPDKTIEAVATESHGVELRSTDLLSDETRAGNSGAARVLLDGTRVLGVAFSANGRWLGALLGDSVSVWDAREFAMSLKLSPPAPKTSPNAGLSSFAFSPDGKRASTVLGGQISLWGLPGGVLIAQLQLEADATAVAFSPDGRLLAVGTVAGVSLWRLDDRPEAFALWASDSFEGIEGRFADSVEGIEFSPDSERLLVSTAIGDVRLWAIPERRKIQEWHQDRAGHAGWWDGSTPAVISGNSRPAAINLYQAGKSVPRDTIVLDEPGANYSSFRIGTNGRWFVSTVQQVDDLEPRLLIPWDASTRKRLAVKPFELRGTFPMESFALHPTEPIVAIGGYDESLRIWNFKTDTWTTLTGHSSAVEAFSYTPAGDLVSCSDDATLLWRNGQGPPEPLGPAALLVVPGPGGRLALVDFNYSVQLILKPGGVRIPLPIHSYAEKNAAGIPEPAFSPDGHWLAVAVPDRGVRVFDLPALERFFDGPLPADE